MTPDPHDLRKSAIEDEMIERGKERDDAMRTAREAILSDLYLRYHDGDRTVFPLTQDRAHRWHKPQAHYFSGNGSIKCPVCGAGILSYSRSGYNGHVHARCSTVGCVAWME